MAPNFGKLVLIENELPSKDFLRRKRKNCTQTVQKGHRVKILEGKLVSKKVQKTAIFVLFRASL